MNPHSVKSLYIHIPFCHTICPFCAFSVLPEPKTHQPYLDLLIKEFALIQDSFSLDLSQVISVYLGGGTPSRLTIPELSWLKSQLPDTLSNPMLQWTIELNPEDVTLTYARSLRGLGFNRVSLGVQSFSDRCLESLGRIHRSQQSHQAFDALTQAGFADINLDFMFGYPGQSAESFEADLEHFTALPVNHLSAYALGIEKGSKIYRNPQWSRYPEEHEQLISERYLEVISRFEAAGFKQYEVSNFAKPGAESTQNLSNWAGEPYLGLGMSAHGYLAGRRTSNHRRFKEYREALTQNQLPWEADELLSTEQIKEEAWMLGLRKPSGVNLIDFFQAPQQAMDTLATLQNQGLISLQDTQLSFTPKGMLLADELSSYLLSRKGVDLLF